jgi:hypothetical protein
VDSLKAFSQGGVVGYIVDADDLGGTSKGDFEGSPEGAAEGG